jgi:hypothetical protein
VPNVDRLSYCGWVKRQEVGLSSCYRGCIGTGTSIREGGRSSTEQGPQLEEALVAEVVLVNEAATKAIRVTEFNWVGQVDLIAFAIESFRKGRTLLLVSYENEHQLTETA